MRELLFRRIRGGFTLVELIMSMGILVVLMLTLVSITNAIRRTWTSTTGTIEQFRDAREAFESVTRKLSQATLNTYWDYQKDSSGNPMTSGSNAYIRQSELRFITGEGSALVSSTSCATHAVFFQAPLGFVSGAAAYSSLKSLINTWGYFVQFGDDSAYRPTFISPVTKWPLRYRFRLMELMQPSQSMTVYNYTSGLGRYQPNQPNCALYVSYPNPPTGFTGLEWFTDALNLTPVPTHPLAENVIAMVLLPKLTPADQIAGSYTDASLTSNLYYYDSTAPDPSGDPNLDPKNQLPPVVQVTMVAVDEASYSRFQIQYGSSIPSVLGLGGLFAQVGDTTNPSNPGYAKDLQTLQSTLASYKLNYRVFTSNVSIKSAKWSRFQQN